MIDAGMNVVSALMILEQQTSDSALAEVIAQLREDVESGLLLSEAMAAPSQGLQPALRRDGRGG